MVFSEKLTLAYVGCGVRKDYETLMSRYAEQNSVRYEIFSSIWRQLRLSELFCLRTTDRECREFTEECMRLALEYVSPERDVQTRICSLYILYALYHKQICIPPTKIRITTKNWGDLCSLRHEIRRQRHLDAEYIFTSLQVVNAFTFASQPQMLYPENEHCGDDKERLAAGEAEVIERAVAQEPLPTHAVEQLSAIHQHYEQMKCALEGPSSTRPHSSLDVIKPNLVQNLTRLVAENRQKRAVLLGRSTHKRLRRESGGRPTTSDSEVESEAEIRAVSDHQLDESKRSRQFERGCDVSQGSRRAAIRNKAFHAQPKTARYRAKRS